MIVGIIKRFIIMRIVFITCFAIANFIMNLILIDKVDTQQFGQYETVATDITYKLSSGKETNIIFGTESVKIVDSYRLNRKERIEVLCFISYCFEQKNIDCSRTIQNLEGEVITHNLLYELRYKTDSTKDTDLDYIKDKRWYVNTATIIMQILGL